MHVNKNKTMNKLAFEWLQIAIHSHTLDLSFLAMWVNRWKYTHLTLLRHTIHWSLIQLSCHNRLHCTVYCAGSSSTIYVFYMRYASCQYSMYRTVAHTHDFNFKSMETINQYLKSFLFHCNTTCVSLCIYRCGGCRRFHSSSMDLQ